MTSGRQDDRSPQGVCVSLHPVALVGHAAPVRPGKTFDNEMVLMRRIMFPVLLPTAYCLLPTACGEANTQPKEDDHPSMF
jgi:hypothetical protein